MFKKRWWLSLLIVPVLLSGCGGTDRSAYSEAKEMTQESCEEDRYNDSSFKEDNTSEKNEKVTEVGRSPLDSTRKYIQHFYYDLDTLTFDDSRSAVESLVNSKNGYIESSSQNLLGYRKKMQRHERARYAEYVLRIPINQMVDFESELADFGYISSSKTEVEDVTNQYFDTEVHLKTLKVREERLLKLMEKADELEAILELEKELARVRYEIESLEASFRQLKNRVQYSTVYLTLREVFEASEIKVPAETFGERLHQGFGTSLRSLSRFFEELALFLLTKSPILILVVVVIYFIILLIRRLARRKRSNQEDREVSRRQKNKTVVEPEVDNNKRDGRQVEKDKK